MDTFIDIYCERTGPGLWAEPLNALSNVTFFIAALFFLFLAKREKAFGIDTALLILLLFAIGTGSTLFHTLATGWAMIADTLPILLFQIVFLWLYSGRVIGFGWRGRSALLALFLITVAGFGILPQHWLNGSVSYLPALLFLTGLGIFHYKTRQNQRWMLLAAALLFTFSLGFRTADIALCPAFPVGVHFLWHLLNGFVLYLSSAALIFNYKPRDGGG